MSNAASYKIRNESIVLFGKGVGSYLVNSIMWNETKFTSEYVSAVVLSAGVGKRMVDVAQAGHPPLLVISSEDDYKVPVSHEQSKAYVDKLKALGGIVHLLTYYTSGHYPEKEPSFYRQIDAFLDSPSTYEAPDTRTTTTTPAPSTCKPFCYRDSQEWSWKCSWKDCSTCDECEGTTITTCPPWCSRATQAWSAKCTWADCSLCPQC